MTLIAARDNDCNSSICIIFTIYYFPPKNTYYEYSMTLHTIYPCCQFIDTFYAFFKSTFARNYMLLYASENSFRLQHGKPTSALAAFSCLEQYWVMHASKHFGYNAIIATKIQTHNNKVVWGCNMVTNTGINTIRNVSPTLSILKWYMQLNYMLQILAARQIHIQIIYR